MYYSIFFKEKSCLVSTSCTCQYQINRCIKVFYFCLFLVHGYREVLRQSYQWGWACLHSAAGSRYQHDGTTDTNCHSWNWNGTALFVICSSLFTHKHMAQFYTYNLKSCYDIQDSAPPIPHKCCYSQDSAPHLPHKCCYSQDSAFPLPHRCCYSQDSASPLPP